jgi:hypothetical protein
MPSKPVQHNGIWWMRRDDGIWLRWHNGAWWMRRNERTWLRWDETGAARVDPNATTGRQGPFGTAGAQQVQQRSQATTAAAHRDRIAASSGTTHASQYAGQPGSGQQ